MLLFKLEWYNGCYDMLMLCLNISDITIIIKCANYRGIIQFVC